MAENLVAWTPPPRDVSKNNDESGMATNSSEQVAVVSPSPTSKAIETIPFSSPFPSPKKLVHTTPFASPSPSIPKQSAAVLVSPTLSRNPWKVDPSLRTSMDRLPEVTNVRGFVRWKASFLRRLESFLETEERGSFESAFNSYKEFGKHVLNVKKQWRKVQSCLDRRTLGGVQGRMAMSEWNKRMVESVRFTQDELFPSKQSDEHRKGYTKYHLGYVLVQDGFSESEGWKSCVEGCKEVKNGLATQETQSVVDKQHWESMDSYIREFQRFIQVLEDLGLYQVLLACRKFGSVEDDVIVLLHPASGAVMEYPRSHLVERGLLTAISDRNGHFREEEQSKVELDALRKTIQSTFLE